MKAISVRQPWAWLLIHGGKDIENRDWRYLPTYRGPIAIHAAKGMTKGEYNGCEEFLMALGISNATLPLPLPEFDELARGAIIGTMEMRGAVRNSQSPWFQGPIGLVLESPKPCDPIPVSGALGLWDWNPPEGFQR